MRGSRSNLCRLPFENTTGYTKALEICELETLEERRQKLCKTFAIKASKHPKHSNWFIARSSVVDTLLDHFRALKSDRPIGAFKGPKTATNGAF